MTQENITRVCIKRPNGKNERRSSGASEGLLERSRAFFKETKGRYVRRPGVTAREVIS